MMVRILTLSLLLVAASCDGKASQAAATPGSDDGGAAPAPAAQAMPWQAGGVVLQYHHVAEDTPAVTSISPDQFRKHMDYLVNNDYVVWPLDRLVDALRNGEQVPDRTVTITFDDAYLDIYTAGFPILTELALPFTVFVSTEFIGNNRRQYLNWQQLEEMQKAGGLIANHTHSHTHLLRKEEGESESEWKERVRSEIVTAGEKIRENLGTTTNLFAYPYGEYNDEVMEIVDELGYTAFGQQSGPMGPLSNFLALPRFPMSGRYSQLDSVKTKLDTLPLPVADGHVEPLLSLSETRPALTLHFTRDDLRFSHLVCYGPSGTTQLTRENETTFVAQTREPVPVGRSRYNCTMPVSGTNRFYWFSQLWIRRNPDGTWYPEL